jgi:hypothetical protein
LGPHMLSLKPDITQPNTIILITDTVANKGK